VPPLSAFPSEVVSPPQAVHRSAEPAKSNATLELRATRLFMKASD
jgi:hypothetical protein